MIEIINSHILKNKTTKETALEVYFIKSCVSQSEKNNDFIKNKLYTIYYLCSGSGDFNVDMNKFSFRSNTLFFISPDQSLKIESNNLQGYKISFSRDFYCIETHKKEVSCEGVLFNNLYQKTIIELSKNDSTQFEELIKKIIYEFNKPSFAKDELLISYLKIFLIHATRLKLSDKEELKNVKEDHNILIKLKSLVEENYKTKHTASEYADLLFLSPKALGKQIKKHTGKTISNIINDRIILEAKRELLYSDKTIKEIGFELGFDDPAYFSRYFKKATEHSPEDFRKTIGENCPTFNLFCPF